MKTVPAGVSKKTGKAYQAFQACSNRECTYKAPKTAAPVQQQAPSVANHMLLELQEIKAVLCAINAKLGKQAQKPVVDELGEVEEDGADVPF
jgi:hypothetical protein